MTYNDQFKRHRGPVTCAIEIPGSNQIVTSAYDGAVGIFNAETSEVKLLGYHQHLVNRVSCNPQGTLLATTSSDYNIYIWDLQTEQLKTVLKGHSDDVEDFVFISDTLGASVSRDWRIIIWNLDKGGIERIILGHEKDVLAISYLDGKLYTTGDDMTLRVWELETGREVAKMGPFETETDTCAIDASNKRIILGCDDGFVRVFELDTWTLLAEVEGHQSAIKKVAVSPTNGDILSAAYDQQILIWDALSFECKKRLDTHHSLWERSFNWSADGQRVIAGTFDGTVLIWDAQTGHCIAEIGKSTEQDGNPCFNEATSLPNNEFCTVSDDGLLRIGILSEHQATWKKSTTPDSGRVLMNAIASNSEGDQILSGTHNQHINYFNYSDGAMVQITSVNLKEGPINCIKTSTLQGYFDHVFVACYSGNIAHLAPNGRPVRIMNVHENAVKALRLHPFRPLGVSCSADGSVSTWDFEGKILQNYKGHTAIVDDLDIDPTGKYVASTGRDFTLKVHDLESATLLHCIHLGNRSPKSMIFLTEHVVVVTNYWGELIKVDLTDHSVVRNTIAKNGISSVVRHGQFLLASSYDGGIYLVDPKDLSVTNSLHAMVQKVEEAAYA